MPSFWYNSAASNTSSCGTTKLNSLSEILIHITILKQLPRCSYRLSWWKVNCFRSWFSYELVQKLDISKCTPCHHSIITPPSPIRVEFTRCESKIRTFKKETTFSFAFKQCFHLLSNSAVITLSTAASLKTTRLSAQDVKNYLSNTIIINHEHVNNY